MNLEDYSKSDIQKIKIIQRNLRNRLNDVKQVNDKMNRLYNIMYGIMKRIHNNFILGIIDQFEYNSYMNTLDSQLSILKKIPRPYKLSDLNDKKNYNIIDNILDNLFDIVKKTGSDSIFDIIFLCYRKKTQNILENFNKETKNLLYFYNNVFIPLEVDIYKNNEVKNTNKKSIIPVNSKLNKKIMI